jgi:hypothetical protein
MVRKKVSLMEALQDHSHEDLELLQDPLHLMMMKMILCLCQV